MEDFKLGKKIASAWIGLWIIAGVGNAYGQLTLSSKWSSYAGGQYMSDAVLSMASDASTNCYFGGFLGSGQIENNNGVACSTTYSYKGGNDGFVAKAGADGDLQWYLCLGSSTKDEAICGIALHTNGTLRAVGTLGFDDEIDDTDVEVDALIASINCADGTVLWTRTLGDVNLTNGFNAVAVDNNGYSYAVGYTTMTNLSNRISSTQYKGNTDAVVVKYSPSGTLVWSYYLGGTNLDTATACAVSDDGYVYVGGQTCSPGWASLTSRTPNPTNSDAFLVKLTTNGVHVWSAMLGGRADDAITALAKGPSSTLFVGGSTASSDLFAGTNRLNSFFNGTDGFVVQLTDNGANFRTNWCRFFGGSTTDCVSALTLAINGSLAVGGTTDSGSWLTQTTNSTFSGVQDGFISLLDSSGAIQWSAYVGGQRNENLYALASSGALVFTGGSTYSTNWVSRGFWGTWDKFNFDEGDSGDGNYGFIATWSADPGVAPAITDDPDDATVYEGNPVTFSIAATGTKPLKYQWFRNGDPLVGAASNAYVIAAVAPTDNNDTYACMVSNYYGVATSQVARLTIISRGTLTVTLAPSQAVSQGAVWSMNGGTTWFASGASTNLFPGTYTVSFTNLTGWTAPAALANVSVASLATTATSGLYTAILPSASRAISGTNVALSVQAPAGLSQWSLVETLPAALTPTAYSSGGVWSSAAHTLTFSGPAAYTNTLSYTVSAQTSGAYTVGGTITPSPANIAVAVTGDTLILKANFIRRITGTNIVITVTQPTAGVWWYVHELLPAGLTATEISGPLIDYSDNELYWQKKGVGTNLSFVVSGAPGTYVFTNDSWGQIGSVTELIFGDAVLTIADPNGGADTNTPPPNILHFVPVNSTTYALTFTSVVSRTYLILTNASVGNTNGWATCLSLSGQAGTTQQQVPAGSSNLFYRVRLQP
jgi:hypothetical protein